MITDDDLKRWRAAAAFTLGSIEGGPAPDDVRKLIAGLMRTTWNELTEKIGDGRRAPTEGESVEFAKVMADVVSW